jgi:hypothetical protein
LPTWLNESLADGYALARHIQLNGDDGFAEVIAASRQLSFDATGARGHYTVPALDRIIPRLKEAHTAGDLEGLSPVELRDFTVTALLGANEQEALRNQAEIRSEISGAAYVQSSKERTLSSGDQGVYAPRPDLSRLFGHHAALYAERLNSAYDVYSNPHLAQDVLATNTSEATVSFREELDDYI